MKIDHSVVTDTGRKRTENQDSFGIVPEAGFYAVLDGMGGAAAGDFASKAAAQIMIAAMTRLTNDEADRIVRAEVPEKIKGACAAIRLANRALSYLVTKYPRLSGMGTTVVAVIFDDEEGMAHILHVGDSRLYRVRCGSLCLLTRDHSKINELIAQGKMNEEDARTAEIQSMITRALGTSPVVKIDCLSIPVIDGDCFILCTDGLNGELEDSDIADIANDFGGRPGAVARALVEAANNAGGRDNTTVLSLRISDTGLSDPALDDPETPLTLDDEIPEETANEDALIKKFIPLSGIRIPRMAKERNFLVNPLTIGIGAALIAAAAVIVPGRYEAPHVSPHPAFVENTASGVALDIRTPSPAQLTALHQAEDSVQRVQVIQDCRNNVKSHTAPLENVQILVSRQGNDQPLFKSVSGAMPVAIKLDHGNYTIQLSRPGYSLFAQTSEGNTTFPVTVESGNALKPLQVIMVPAADVPKKGGDCVENAPQDTDNR